MGSLPNDKPARARGWLLASTGEVKEKIGISTLLYRHPCPLLTQSQLHFTLSHALEINSTPSNVYIFSVTILHMQNSTPTVKAETCSINEQTKVLCRKLVFSFTYLIAQSPGHTTCPFKSANAKCSLASEPYALRTVQCCHIALRTAVAVQHSDYKSDKHTAERICSFCLEHCRKVLLHSPLHLSPPPHDDPSSRPQTLYLAHYRGESGGCRHQNSCAMCRSWNTLYIFNLLLKILPTYISVRFPPRCSYPVILCKTDFNVVFKLSPCFNWNMLLFG
jgi:hypothetical protein